MLKKDETIRKRMVVEEVNQGESPDANQEPVEPARNASSMADAGGELKEKVGELQTLTEGISESAEKSSEVQKEIVEAVEKVIPAEPASGPGPMTIILPGILLLGALLGGIIFYQNKISKSPAESTAPLDVPTATVEATPTSTPTTTVDLAKFKIAVFNGGGTPGEAGKAKTLLETAGFTVSSAGNAKSYSFTKTIIGAKSTVDKGFLDALTTALGKTYVVGTNETIATSSADSVVVTIGSSKK